MKKLLTYALKMNLKKKSVLTTIFFFQIAILFSQPPFGVPNNSINQTQSNDFIIKNNSPDLNGITFLSFADCDCTNWITSTDPRPQCCGNFRGFSIANVDNTGNDIQYFNEFQTELQVIAWDGDRPSFSLKAINYQNNDTVQYLVPFAGLRHLNNSLGASASDPDIIIIQELGPDAFAEIILVYEIELESFTGSGIINTYIAIESWKYDLSNRVLEINQNPQNLSDFLLTPINSFSALDKNFNYDNPNIDGNNNGEIVITYNKTTSGYSNQNIGEIIIRSGYPIGPVFSSTPTPIPPATPNTYPHRLKEGIVRISRDIIDFPNVNNGFPDVAISDVGITSTEGTSTTFNSVISLIFNQLHNGGQGLIHAQNYFNTVYTSTTTEVAFAYVQGLNGGDGTTTRARIDAPRLEDAYTEWESVYCTSRNLQSQNSGFVLCNKTGKGLGSAYWQSDIDPFQNSNYLFGCSNQNLAVSFGGGNYFSVGWSANNLGGTASSCNLSGGSNEKLAAVNYVYTNPDPSNNLRIPSDPDFFMAVNNSQYEKQRHLSMSYLGQNDVSPQAKIFYSNYAEDPQKLHQNVIIYKTSVTANQPLIRISKDIKSQPKIDLYPNPSNGELFLDLSKFEGEKQIYLRLIDLTGRVVFEKSFITESDNQSLKLNHLDKGLYNALVGINGKVTNTKLIISK